MKTKIIKVTTVKELIKQLNKIKDKEQSFKIWGAIDDDGTGFIDVGELEITNF